mmetsp:Transcript_2768/g.7806  ORF Transcript_2768/g.7806 Transcript_2768/m.7806 type:complete len:263 (+) Transcript_2768:279-1067(+)
MEHPEGALGFSDLFEREGDDSASVNVAMTTPIKQLSHPAVTAQTTGPFTPQQTQSALDLNTVTPVTRSCRKPTSNRIPRQMVPSKRLSFEGASELDNKHESGEGTRDRRPGARHSGLFGPTSAQTGYKTPDGKRRATDKPFSPISSWPSLLQPFDAFAATRAPSQHDNSSFHSPQAAPPESGKSMEFMPLSAGNQPRSKVISFGALVAAGMPCPSSPEGSPCRIRPEIVLRAKPIGAMMASAHRKRTNLDTLLEGATTSQSA